jgi:lipopolysaccharide exporter
MKGGGSGPTSVARGATLTVAMRWVDRLIGIASTLILARVLVPDDFGVIAMASLVIGLVDVLFDVGVHVALIQNTDATPEHYHSAWTLRLMQAGLATLLIIGVSPWAAAYFNDARIAPVLQVAAFGVLLAALENIGTVDFQKHMRFGQDFRFTFTKRLAGFVVTIVLAFTLRSYWALVIGSLSGRLVGVGLSYGMHPMRPRLSLSQFRAIFSISQWMIVRSIANYVSANAHRFVVGERGDASVLGGYSLAQEISAMPSTELLAPLNRVLFPAFVKAKHDLDELKRVFLLAQGVQTLIVMPMAVGLVMLAREAVSILLGERWLFVVPFVEVLALASIAQSIAVSASYLLMTRGEFARQTLLVVAQIVLFFAGALLLVPDGDAAAIARVRLAVVVAGLGLTIGLLLHHMPNISRRDIARTVYRPLLACTAMAAAMATVEAWVPPVLWISLPAKAGAGAVTYLAAIGVLWWAAGRPAGSETYVGSKLAGLRPGDGKSR